MSLISNQPEVAQAYEKYRQFNQDEHLRAVDEAHDKGRAERNIEIARNMKQAGSDLDFIAQMTGLSVAEIEQLS